jgi:hypothetical protein
MVVAVRPNTSGAAAANRRRRKHRSLGRARPAHPNELFSGPTIRVAALDLFLPGTRRLVEGRVFCRSARKNPYFLSYIPAFPDRARDQLLGRADLTDIAKSGLLVRFGLGESIIPPLRRPDAEKHGFREMNWSFLRKTYKIGNFGEGLNANDAALKLSGKLAAPQDATSVATPKYPFLTASGIADLFEQSADQFAKHYESELNRFADAVGPLTPGDLGLPIDAQAWSPTRTRRVVKYAKWLHDFAPDPREFSAVINVPLWQPADTERESASIIVVTRQGRWFDNVGSGSENWHAFCEFLGALACAGPDIKSASGRSLGAEEAWNIMAHEVSKLSAAFTTGWMVHPGEQLFTFGAPPENLPSKYIGELRLAEDYEWLRDDIAVLPFSNLLETTGELLRFWSKLGTDDPTARTLPELVRSSFRRACDNIAPLIAKEFGALITSDDLEYVRRRLLVLQALRAYQITSCLRIHALTPLLELLCRPDDPSVSPLRHALTALFTNCVQHGDPTGDVTINVERHNGGRLIFRIENLPMPIAPEPMNLETVLEARGLDLEAIRDVSKALRKASEATVDLGNAHTAGVAAYYLGKIQGELFPSRLEGPVWKQGFSCQLQL